MMNSFRIIAVAVVGADAVQTQMNAGHWLVLRTSRNAVKRPLATGKTTSSPTGVTEVDMLGHNSSDRNAGTAPVVTPPLYIPGMHFKPIKEDSTSASSVTPCASSRTTSGSSLASSDSTLSASSWRTAPSSPTSDSSGANSVTDIVADQDIKNIFTVTYNMEGKIDDIDKIAQKLVAMSGDEPVKVFAFQETFELSKGIWGVTAQVGTYLFGGRPAKIQSALQQKLDAQTQHNSKPKYVVAGETSMWAFYTVVFAKQDLVKAGSVTAVKEDSFSPDYSVGNKGAVAMQITIGDKSVLVLNVHLPSKNGLEADKTRLQMYKDIEKKYASFYKARTKKNVIILGDFNARSSAVEDPQLTALFKSLQVMQNWKGGPNEDIVDRFNYLGHADGLDRFSVAATKKSCLDFKFDLVEAPKDWMPTFQLQRHTPTVERDESPFTTVEVETAEGDNITLHYTMYKTKSRWTWKFWKWPSKLWNWRSPPGRKTYIPSWTDRIFFHGEDATADRNISHYKCDHSLTVSDHAPVSAVITLTV